MKNITTLTIKIFEINVENYYKKNNKEIDNQLNLEGLIASEEIQLKYSQPPALKHLEKFTFEKID